MVPFRVRASRTRKRCLELKVLLLLTAIDRVVRDEDPMIRELAEITHNIFKEIDHRLTSSNVKQTFQRLFHIIYVKKLKPLYYYNWPNNLASSPVKMKETKDYKEGLIDENYEYIVVKNERSTSGLKNFPEEE